MHVSWVKLMIIRLMGAQMLLRSLDGAMLTFKRFMNTHTLGQYPGRCEAASHSSSECSAAWVGPVAVLVVKNPNLWLCLEIFSVVLAWRVK